MASSHIPTYRQDPGTHLGPHNLLQNGPLLAQRRTSDGSSSSSSNSAMKRMREPANRTKANSTVSRETQHTQHTSGSNSHRTENRAVQRAIRTLPPWIDSYEKGDEPLLPAKSTGRPLAPPPRAHNAQHNNAPQPPRRISQDGYVDTYEEQSQRLNEKKSEGGFFGSKEPVKGRKWDHVRDSEPVIMQAGVLPTSSQWRAYLKSTMYGPGASEDGKVVTEDFLRTQTPGYDRPWRGDLDAGNDPEKLSGLLTSKKQRRSLWRRWQHIMLMHPLVPLIFRLIVLGTSLIALGLSTSVHHLSDKYRFLQSPSTTMAVIVDVVALPYIIYVTWDEYTGKPLGLRSPKAKIRLVLLDLFFIIFESANLALSFASLTDTDGSCKIGESGTNSDICRRIKTLCSILFVALVAWSMTFAVSIFRLVERVGGREDGD